MMQRAGRVMVSALCAWLCCAGNVARHAPAASSTQSTTAPTTLTLLVEGNDWGASTADVQKVITSAADQLVRFVPNRHIAPIHVTHHHDAPITLDAKASAVDWQMRLPASSTFWAQYAYEFSHEICHVMCRCDQHHRGQNQWFEESLCETSSLFCLSRLPAAWEREPPYPNWKLWGVHFQEYEDHLLADPARRLPPNLTMQTWMEKTLPTLRKERELTERSRLVAAYLLPIFQADPDGWDAISYLNQNADDDEVEFKTYLEHWRNRCPSERRVMVERIEQLFGYVR